MVWAGSDRQDDSSAGSRGQIALIRMPFVLLMDARDRSSVGLKKQERIWFAWRGTCPECLMRLQLTQEDENPWSIWSAGALACVRKTLRTRLCRNHDRAQPRVPPPHRAKCASGTPAAAVLGFLKGLQRIFDRVKSKGTLANVSSWKSAPRKPWMPWLAFCDVDKQLPKARDLEFL
jgi:hypothetical protein